MNIRLLRKIAKVIQEKPKQFDMQYLHKDRKTGDCLSSAHNFDPKDCGTAHCIGGWAAILEKNQNIANGPKGEEAFGVDRNQLSRLLFTAHWPKKLESEYHARKTDAAKARVAARRIEHFILTDGAE